MSEPGSRTSPLHTIHVELGAKMADFGGWSMPIEYPGGGVVAEHKAVRERVGMFDVSHLGKAMVRGEGAADYVNSALTNDLRRIGPGQAQYTMCCNADGGVVDDLIVYLVSEQEVFLIPNAANTSGVVAALAESAPAGIEVQDAHVDYAVIAVQGPDSPQVVGSLGLPTDHPFMSFVQTRWQGVPVWVCRTGYTGERGYELLPRSQDAAALWTALMGALKEHDGKPCGLGARDTLRTEMAYALHGQDLSPQITPVMARAGWAVGWDKPAFWGKEALSGQRAEKSGPLARGLLVTGRGIPRAGCTVSSAGGKDVGTVTSGTFSPTLKQGIALALLDRGTTVGDEVSIDVRGRAVPAEVVAPPFVQAKTTD
ncbi:MAG TPA: glycine cleavage system aminomethyltransferase GcvT [Ornithinimicrobium sp.]|uniref:glycine cleavage system aminomethyltransferase GcvT n=1 Tax=Ornithinimicrobium sp. TaxID=1977084 RepID=UPI002B4707EF|nr:glycine cleavage system aminomethyltransferase GcvT [Ornithinimicrobium sp.]HKJ11915.1 glycine cleavage system aminomethyltransferase GcvT [Ornithinimicrobium sp.]